MNNKSIYNKDLIILAKKLGFESKFFSDQPWKYSDRELMRYQLWLEELKQWIADNFNIYVEIERTCIKIPIGNTINIINRHFIYNIKDIRFYNNKSSFGNFNTYLKALSAGIYKTLNTINKNN